MIGESKADLKNYIERLSGRYWRVTAPSWGFDPISGNGAALKGGRWNRPSQPTTYAAAELDTAMDEYWQDVDERPGTFFAIDVTAARVLDFRRPGVALAAGLAAEDRFCLWEQIVGIDGLAPPTWLATDAALAAGANGLIVPSARRPDHTNIVLWRSKIGGANVTVHDPNGEMPKPPANER